METKSEAYRRYFFVAILLIALGVIFSTTLKGAGGSLGIVFVATGTVLFIMALSKRRREVE